VQAKAELEAALQASKDALKAELDARYRDLKAEFAEKHKEEKQRIQDEHALALAEREAAIQAEAERTRPDTGFEDEDLAEDRAAHTAALATLRAAEQFLVGLKSKAKAKDDSSDDDSESYSDYSGE